VTTRAESERLRAVSRQLVADLRQAGAQHVADRLARCAAERRQRRPGVRNWSCRSVGCPWCGRALLRRWQGGLHDWVGGDAGDASYVVVPLAGGGELRGVVRAYRRALRDWLGRRGRSSRAWRAVAAGGLVMPRAGGRVAVLRVCHTGLTRAEVAAAFAARWPGAVVSSDEPPAQPPAWSQTDRLSLAVLRRGAEAVRVVLRPHGERHQRQTQAARTDLIEPTPMVFGWY
jgi:hypothetical protein